MTTKPEMHAAAAATLEWLKTTLESGADAIAEQAPLLFREVIFHGRIYETAALLFFIALSIAGLVTLRFAIRFRERVLLLAKEQDRSYLRDYEEIIIAVTAALGGGMLVVGTIAAMTQFGTALLPWAAPRLYFIERLVEVAA